MSAPIYYKIEVKFTEKGESLLIISEFSEEHSQKYVELHRFVRDNVSEVYINMKDCGNNTNGFHFHNGGESD